MATDRKRISVCIPAYNRARYLAPLLDSIFSQDFDSYEVLICEDGSPQRDEIRAVARSYQERFPGILRYYENPVNLGYDANIRNLVEKASGEYCFFMGNDDLMAEGALLHVDQLIRRHPEVGLIVKSYVVFDGTPDVISHELRYFTEEREFPPGRQALVLCYRRSGVISGYIVKRDEAHACATDRFDGTLYYQMHLTASILLQRPAVFTPQVLVLCRSNEPPDFGHSEKERETYTPGRYTPQARLNMVRGALSILTELPSPNRDELLEAVRHDYANYFYPFIKDQLTLPVAAYFKLYRDYWSLGFGKYPLFHVYCIGCYALGEKLFDRMTRVVRKRLGRTVQIGMPTR